jgi:hypothetical protein
MATTLNLKKYNTMKKLFFAIAILFSVSSYATSMPDTIKPTKPQKAVLRAKNISPKQLAGKIVATKAAVNISAPDTYDSSFNLVVIIYGTDTTNQTLYQIKFVNAYKGTVLGNFPPTVPQQEAKAATDYGLTFLN